MWGRSFWFLMVALAAVSVLEGQTIYMFDGSSDRFFAFDVGSCTMREVCKHPTPGVFGSGLTFLPSNDLWSYGVGGVGYQRLDTFCNGFERLLDFSIRPRIDDIVSDDQGILWGLGNQIVRVDPTTLTFEVRSPFPLGVSERFVPFQGCAIYHQRLRKIYHVNAEGEIFETDTNDIRQSRPIAQCDICSQQEHLKALTYVRESCISDRVYCIVGDLGWYALDLFTGKTTLVCAEDPINRITIPEYSGIPWEIAPTACRLRIDLDISNQTLPGADKRKVVSCDEDFAEGWEVLSDTTNVELFSDAGVIDSLHIELSGVRNGNLEYLTWGSGWNVERRNRLLKVETNTGSPSSYMQFVATLQYFNDACLYSKGLRQISFVIYSDTLQAEAIYYLDIGHDRVDAGPDAVFALCEDEERVSWSLDSCTTSGGRWIPPLSTANQFDVTQDRFGNYLYVVGVDTCRPDTAVYTFLEMPVPRFDLGRDTQICDPMTIGYLGDTTGISFVWEDGSMSSKKEVTQSGEYVLMAMDTARCNYTDTVNIIFLTRDTSLEEYTICAGDTLDWMGKKYWMSGTYLEVSLESCDLVEMMHLRVEEEQDLLVDSLVLCGEIDYEICVLGDCNYEWSTGDKGACITVSQTGTYSVWCQIGNGCIVQDSMKLIFEQDRWTHQWRDTSVAFGEEVEWGPIVPASLGVYYIFDRDTIETPRVRWLVERDTSFQLCVRTENGCYFCKEIFVKVKGPKLYIPNAFSPNGDNINDLLMGYGGHDVVITEIQIYSRWGELVHREVNTQSGKSIILWDGEYGGVPAQPGVYPYVIGMKSPDGKIFYRSGHVTLLH